MPRSRYGGGWPYGRSLFRKKIFAEVVDDIVANRALMYLVGVITVGLGLISI